MEKIDYFRSRFHDESKAGMQICYSIKIRKLIGKGKPNRMEINKEKLQKLIIGSAGIYSLYFVGAAVQERIMKNPYENKVTGEMETFQNSNAFILLPSAVSWIIGHIYNMIYKPDREATVPQVNWIKSSVLVILGALSMTRAIYETSYPLVTLFKSCNLLSVLVIGIFFSRVKEKSQKLEKKQIVVGLVVTLGVLMYYLGPISQASDQELVRSYFGLGLLFFSLICDGLVPDFQAEIKTKYKPTPMEMFQHMNKWKTILSLAYSLLTLEIRHIVTFFMDHDGLLLHMLCLSLTGAVGQIFVYWLITNFRQHVVPFIITTRKIMTVVISILYFGHRVTFSQKTGIVIVFLAVLFEFVGEIRGGSQAANKSNLQLSTAKNVRDNEDQTLLSVQQITNETILEKAEKYESLQK